MKVMLDISHLHGSRGGGIHFYVENLVAALSECPTSTDLQLRYFNLYWRTRNPALAHPTLRSPRCAHIRCPVKLLNLFWLYLNVPDLSRRFPDIDIFHGTHFSLPVMSRAKLLLTVHDVMYLTHPEYYDPRWKSTNDYGYRTLLPRNIKRADHIIAISEFTKQQLMDVLPVPEEKISVVHHAVPIPPELSYQRLDELLARFDLTRDSYIYFPAGTYEQRKNIRRTMEAFTLAAQQSALKLIISGIGDPTPYRTNDSNICFVQWYHPEEKHALFQGALFVVFPSISEGFGVPVVEALAHGKALITSHCAAMKEIAEGYARLVDPENRDEIIGSFTELINDVSSRAKLAVKATFKARDFSHERIRTELQHVYRHLCSTSERITPRQVKMKLW